MQWTVLAASAEIAAALWLPAEAAQPAAPAASGDPFTFEQYRDWRLAFIERRQTDLARQLAASDLPAQRKTRLEQGKAYYDWLAGLPEADRDPRLHEHFDPLDANHDRQIHPAHRAARHE